MKKVILRLVVLFCIFVGCVIGFSMRMNSRTVVRETGLARPTLPVLYMRISGHTANRMEGHVRALTEVTERSSVTPLPS